MNANKIVGGGTAGGLLAALVIYLCSRVGWTLTAEDGSLVSSALVAFGAFIAHNGIVGAVKLLWRGSGKQPDPPAAT